MQSNCTKQKICFKCGQQHESKECTTIMPKCTNCNGEHPANSNLCPKQIERKLAMKKVLLDKCTPQQARLDIKNKTKLIDIKPRTKPVKVNVPTKADTDDTRQQSCFVLVLILGKVPKMIDPKTKIEFMAELSLKLFDIRLDVDQILNKYIGTSSSGQVSGITVMRKAK